MPDQDDYSTRQATSQMTGRAGRSATPPPTPNTTSPVGAPERALLVEIRQMVTNLQPLLDLLRAGSLGQGEDLVAQAYNLLVSLKNYLAHQDEREERLLGQVQALCMEQARMAAQVAALHALLLGEEHPEQIGSEAPTVDGDMALGPALER